MSTLFSSIMNIAGNYGQGITTIQVQLEEMKFGFLPPPSAAISKATTNTTVNAFSSTPISSNSSSRKNSCNNNTINMSIMGSTSLNTTSDFNQWLHAMKMVARLPGGTPPEFRRKLWLALADRHLHTSGIDWNKEQTKCLSEAWLDDDEELGIQIVKDLHRTGSSLFSGPNGSVNQAKLKRVLLGYARWNPEVGYCQGFNMLGALILQVMDKSEIEALKVMIYLIEGVLPNGYFSGSLGGLQADMAVFREILSTRLPKLSKHLQKLQGPVGEGSLEPPLINVFTMQWFLTLFCTCLPKSCVLRVWDLVLIEGSDILLRTALAIWGLLAERIFATKSADDFYCKMGTLSGELLNGHLFDSNGLIQRIVDLGPIADLQKMREKHLFNITPWKDRKGLKIFYSDDDADSDDETWKFISGARRASLGISAAAVAAAASATNRNQVPLNDTRERIALDISLLKKQYAKLRERQRQAHIILTNTAKQTVNPTMNYASQPINVNQYLMGRSAIVSSKGRRIGPPVGAVPPVRVMPPTSSGQKQQQKRFRNAPMDNATSTVSTHKRSDDNFNIKNSLSATSSISSISSTSEAASTSLANRNRTRKRSESSSYSEDDSDVDEEDVDFQDVEEDSSTSTSLCDEDLGNASSIEASPLKARKPTSAPSDDSRHSSTDTPNITETLDAIRKYSCSSLGHSSEYKSFPNLDGEHDSNDSTKQIVDIIDLVRRHSETDENSFGFENDILDTVFSDDEDFPNKQSRSSIEINDLDLLTLAFRQQITSTSQLSPIADIAKFLSSSSISPLKTPASCLLNSYPLCDLPAQTDVPSELPKETATGSDLLNDLFKVSDEGVTNEYFERINQVNSVSVERPSNLNLHDSINNSKKLTPVNQVESDASVSSGYITPSIKPKPPDTLPFIPICADITPEQSPLLNESSKAAFTCTDHDEQLSCRGQKINYLKEKSISMDDGHELSRKRHKNDDEHGTMSLPISCPEQSTSTDYNSISESNKNTDRVLKIIEENSKILDQIMSKNVKSNSKSKCDNELNIAKAEATQETNANIKKLYLSPDFDLRANSTNDILCSSSSENVTDPMKSNFDMITSNEICKISDTNAISPEIRSDEKCDIITDLISNYMKKFEDDLPKNCLIEHSEISLASAEQMVSLATDSKSIKSASPLSILPPIDLPCYKIADLETIRADDEGSKSQTIEDFILQSVARTSTSPKQALLDSKIENDLQSLLEMSAALLRDELPLNLSAAADTNEILDETNIIDNNITDTTSATLLDLDSTETLTSKRNSAYLELNMLDIAADDSAGDISATISSIKNTIKSIDTLCQDDDRRSRERADKTLNNIIKVVEQLEEGKESRTKNHIEEQSELIAGVPTILEHIPISESQHPKSAQPMQYEEKKEIFSNKYLTSSRVSRDRSRVTSPRRRKDDNFGEYESRARRSQSPVFMAPISGEHAARHNRYSGDFSSKYSLDNFKASTSSANVAGGIMKPASPYKTNEKLEIRHTTVTSTFYDRFLSQKLEQQHKMDRSPSSPIITKAYLDTLKPVAQMSNSYPSDTTKDKRNSKSNENSPVRSSTVNRFDTDLGESTLSSSCTTTAPRSSYLLMPQLSINAIDRSSTYTKSCDNIPSNLNKNSIRSKTFLSGANDYEEMDQSFKPPSATGTLYHSSSLQIKPKKPSELGIKLGLYKPL